MAVTENEHFVLHVSIGSEATLVLGNVFFGDGGISLFGMTLASTSPAMGSRVIHR